MIIDDELAELVKPGCPAHRKVRRGSVDEPDTLTTSKIDGPWASVASIVEAIVVSAPIAFVVSFEDYIEDGTLLMKIR